MDAGFKELLTLVEVSLATLLDLDAVTAGVDLDDVDVVLGLVVLEGLEEEEAALVVLFAVDALVEAARLIWGSEGAETASGSGFLRGLPRLRAVTSSDMMAIPELRSIGCKWSGEEE